MKRNLILVLLASLCVHLQAQVTFQDAYDQFKQQAKEEYGNFRDEANKQLWYCWNEELGLTSKTLCVDLDKSHKSAESA